ncbi:MAG: hypothetical protein ACYCSA_05810 [Thermoplasmataceae archaeon]
MVEIGSPRSSDAGRCHYLPDSIESDNDRVDVISARDGVFRVFSANPILEFLSEKMSQLPIMAVNRSQRFEKTRLKMDVILPEVYASSYIDIVSESIDEFPDWNITLSASCRFGYVEH